MRSAFFLSTWGKCLVGCAQRMCIMTCTICDKYTDVLYRGLGVAVGGFGARAVRSKMRTPPPPTQQYNCCSINTWSDVRLVIV